MEFLGDFKTSPKKALKEIDSNYEKYDALVVCGSHNPKDPDYIIERIRDARQNGRPFLGICYGYQLACIEIARNVDGVSDATSEEWGKGTFIIKKRPKLKVGVHNGESWWSNYEVTIPFQLPENMIAVPYHPEYQSSKENPHPVLVKFIELCRKYASDGLLPLEN